MNNLSGRTIGLLVTGSIAAYKSAELCRELKRRGADVYVAMTPSATEFISPLTFQTLSGHPVTTKLFDEASEAEIGHIAFADRCDLLLVAPATADTIAKAAAGFAENAVLAILLASTKPVLFAPAMNVNMWNHPATQKNLVTLRERGAAVVDPANGELACGWVGEGRLADLSAIVAHVEQLLTAFPSHGDLVGRRVIVTAGPTEEPIDPIRFISNRSSGRMGYAIAKAAVARGAEVTLISGPVALPPLPDVRMVFIRTAAELQDTLRSELERPTNENSKDILFMAAAVGDFSLATTSGAKVKAKKGGEISLTLQVNDDILAAIGRDCARLRKQRGSDFQIVGFCAETSSGDALQEEAVRKLNSKQCDFIVANQVTNDPTSAMGGEMSEVWLIGGDGFVKHLSRSGKDVIAGQLIDEVTSISTSRKPRLLSAVK